MCDNQSNLILCDIHKVLWRSVSVSLNMALFPNQVSCLCRQQRTLFKKATSHVSFIKKAIPLCLVMSSLKINGRIRNRDEEKC